MNPLACGRNGRLGIATGGFTLIEVTVALALIGLIAAALVSSLQFGRRSYQKIVRVDVASWDLFTTQRLLRQLIESAYPLDDPAGGLHGSDRRLDVIAPAPRGEGGAGLYLYSIDVQPRGAFFDLAIRWRADLEATGAGAGDAAPPAEILLDKVAGVEWAYCCDEEPGAAAAKHWVSTWSQRRLPQLVRLRIKFADKDARSWPELVIAPRLTDDANCVFDVVAQRCRGTS